MGNPVLILAASNCNIFLICLNGTYHSCPKLHTRIQRWDEYKLNAIFLSFVYSFYILIFLILLKAYLYIWQYFLRHGARSTLRHEIMLHLNVYDWGEFEN